MRHSRLSVMPMKRAAASTGISRTRTSAACSNNSVNRLPGRAHGTTTRLIPWVSQSTRGTRVVMKVVLEEVKMLPRDGGEVVRRAGPPALRAGTHGTAIRDRLEMQLLRPLFGVQTLAGKFPWCTQARTEREHILCF